MPEDRLEEHNVIKMTDTAHEARRAVRALKLGRGNFRRIFNGQRSPSCNFRAKVLAYKLFSANICRNGVFRNVRGYKWCEYDGSFMCPEIAPMIRRRGTDSHLTIKLKCLLTV